MYARQSFPHPDIFTENVKSNSVCLPMKCTKDWSKHPVLLHFVVLLSTAADPWGFSYREFMFLQLS